MKSPLIRTAALIGAAALSLTLTACGGGDDTDIPNAADAPTNASTEDFCASFDALDNVDSDASISEGKKQIAELAKVGTPSDMPEDARRGYVAFIEAIDKIANDASDEELQAALSDVVTTTDFAALGTYVSTTCAS